MLVGRSQNLLRNNDKSFKASGSQGPHHTQVLFDEEHELWSHNYQAPILTLPLI